jgi:hypothetical protein
MNDRVRRLRARRFAKALGAARWTGFKTIVIREYGRIIRIWAQTIVPSAVTSALYFVIFGSLIGSASASWTACRTCSTSRPASS